MSRSRRGRSLASGESTLQGVGLAAYLMGIIVVPLLVSAYNQRSILVDDRALGWTLALGLAGFWWLGWALLTPPILALSTRFAVVGERALRNRFFHGAAFAGILAAHPLIIATGHVLLWPVPPSFWPEYRDILFGFAEIELLFFLAVTAVAQTRAYHRRSVADGRRALRVEEELAAARLFALNRQLQPHFLFNTLHAASAVSRRDPDTARRMLHALHRLLSMTLDEGASRLVSLDRELELLDAYVAIERARFPDRLEVVTRVAPAAREALVPALLLQPLVENAVRHGIAPFERRGTIEIVAELVGDSLDLRIRDDGPAVAEDRHAPSGLGLRNTRQRLDLLYGDHHRMVARATPSGFLVEVWLPLRPATGLEAGAQGDRPSNRSFSRA